MTELRKGMRVHARWSEVEPVALAGETMKLGMSCGDFTGVVKHIRGNRPIAPTSIRIWVQPDDGGEEIVVKPEWIVAVLNGA